MAENQRQQLILERLQEDERLRGDLEDAAATALLGWALERAAAAAADPSRPDEAVESDVRAVRISARAAARSGEHAPDRLIALAEAELQKSLGPGSETGAAGPADSAPRPEAPAESPTMAGAPEIPTTVPPLAPRDAAAPGGAAQPAVEPGAGAPEGAAKSEQNRRQPADAREAVETIIRSRRKRSRLANFLKRMRGRL
jgi:hypothetical protein